ncbi:MAG: rhodanese-like domain-containing protein [Vicinamibacterales bacterium]
MSVPRITKEDLKARLDAGEPLVILDAHLKYPYEHSTVTLPRAVRVAPGAEVPPIPAGRDVVVFDSDPDELSSAPLVALLVKRGQRAAALKGGLPEWIGANFPVEPKTPPPAEE